MCGIVGVLGPQDGVNLDAMLRQLRRRGPDDEGTYKDDQVRLGFRRLSIIDLKGGRQPFINETKDCVLIFNGEIYNFQSLRDELLKHGHRFETASDGEVILHLYEDVGVECLDRLRGMYAFALWDARRQRLFLARDHIGMKPLFYAWDGQRLLFGSQVVALLASGCVERRLNLRAVQRFFFYLAIPPPDTIIEGCRALPAGHYLLASPGSAPVVKRYWWLRHDPRRVPSKAEDAAECLRDAIARTVRSHLQSEVPLGSFLSGGLDSSSIVSFLKEYVPGRLKTFTVGFEGPGTEGYSELPYAQLVADRFGTEHHYIAHTGSSVARELPQMIEAMDQPTTDGINTYLASQIAKLEVTVSFSGTGPDELLLGYNRDAWLNGFRHLRTAQQVVPAPFRRAADRILDWLPEQYLSPSLRRCRSFLCDPHAMLRNYLFAAGSGMALLDPEQCHEILVGRNGSDEMWDNYLDPLALDEESDLEPLIIQISRWEVMGFAGMVLLPDTDAMSMYHSLEVRVPFYDRDFMELVFSLPASLKDPRYGTKSLLKRAMKKDLPPLIIDRLKQGFSLPLYVWLADELLPHLRSALSFDSVRRRGIFDPALVEHLRLRFEAGDSSCYRTLWALLVLESWCRLNLDGRPREALFEP